MARPVRLKSSKNDYFRQRIPADVLAKARGSILLVPVGPGTTRVLIGATAVEVKFSLGTSDQRETKSRHTAAAHYLAKFWDALRRGPVKLTHKQTVALAGEAYADIVRAFEDEPLKVDWQRVQKLNQQALAGRYGMAQLMIGEDNRREAAIEERFGGFADVILARHGLTVDEASRTKLVREVGRILDLSAKRLQQNSEGDYSPDPNLPAFGSFQQPAAAPNSGMTWEVLVEAWAKEAKPKQATVDQTLSSLRHLQKVTGVSDPASLARADVIRWKDVLLDEGLSGKTINASKLAALKAVLNAAVANGRLETNVAEGVKVRQKKKAGSRMREFSDEQASAILAAANAADSAPKHWVPFLCALSGARVSEMTQLRAEDITQKDGIVCLRLITEAGSLKNDPSERDVPLHPFLLEMGFLRFAKTKPKGPLFYDPAKRDPKAKKPASKIVAKNIAEWVVGLNIGVGRKLYRIDPNHAWRHWFQAQARAKGIPDSVVDHIQGQTPANVGQSYGSPNLQTNYRAICKIEVPYFQGCVAQAAECA